MQDKHLHFETKQIHAGLHIDETGSRGIAIHPTAAYHFKSCDYAADLFNLKTAGNIYTRLNNPTNSAYEERIAALYDGIGALSTSSGMSAILLTVTALAGSGDNIVVSPRLYGGTYNQFNISLRRLGVDVRISRDETIESFAKLIDHRTRFIYSESMGNPTCDVPDIEALANLAHSNDMPLVIDNTFGAAGFLCNPFEWGADIVVDSATKWINGHGTSSGGVIVDSGKFDWNNGRYPEIAGPDEGYHGLNLHDSFGNAAFITKCRVDGMRDFGVCSSPFDSYLMMLGLETLSLRVSHQITSTRKIAEAMRKHPKVKKVSYIGFEDHPSHINAKKYYRFGGDGAVFSMELKGDINTTIRFVESLELVKHMTMIGDSVTVVTHPASTTHKQLSNEAMKAAGVTPTLLRVSPGLEHPDDIISDFYQALEKI